jgi:phytoene dehydrogenase-like protein
MDEHVTVVGGGLAGLAAATYLARGGARVTLFERSRALGGRARSEPRGGATLNLGAHALYRGGAGATVLRELGVPFSGREPRLDGALAVRGEQAHALPRGFGSLVTTSLLPFRAKLEAASFLARLPRLDLAAFAGISVAAWLEETFRTEAARELTAALLRLASAGASLGQLALASAKGVLYLDGGWETLVTGLRDRALAAGVQLRVGDPVAELEHDDAVRAVRLASGERVACEAAVIAASPQGLRELLPSAFPEGAIPVEAAALDLVLDGLPRPATTFALGIDRPLYFSVHSRAARLAPEGRELVSLMKYLPVGEAADAARDERELEAFLDLAQPGWRGRVLERRFLPRLQVTGALVRADRGGLTGRPATAVTGVRGLHLAGDWVGSEGQLADASLASAREAARRVLEGLRESARTSA